MSMWNGLSDVLYGAGGLLSIVLLIIQLISCRKGIFKEWMEWMPSVYMLATVMMLVYFLVCIASHIYTNMALVHALMYLALGSVHQMMLNYLSVDDQVECE